MTSAQAEIVTGGGTWIWKPYILKQTKSFETSLKSHFMLYSQYL